jgi:site-specific recombinase XerD
MARKTFKKIITSDENWNLVSKENKKLMERFLKEKNTRCSDTTIEGYKSDLSIFFTWNMIENDNKYFPLIKKLEFAEFFGFATSELKWAGSRFARVRSALSQISESIIKFLDDEFPTYRNLILAAIESMPKEPVREKTILSEEQINSLFDYLHKINKPQEELLLALAIGSGARVSEWLRFTTDIIDKDNTAFEDIFLEMLKPIKTKGRTKTGKQLTKYIIRDVFWERYEKWLPIREQIMKENNKTHNCIFIKSNGDPAQVSTVRSWIAKWEKFLGVNFYPHCLRHYITTFLSKLGLETDLIVEIMGWSDSKMFSIYCDLSAKDKKWKNLDKLQGTFNASSKNEMD